MVEFTLKTAQLGELREFTLKTAQLGELRYIS